MKTACSCHKIFQPSLQPHTPQDCVKVQTLFYFLYMNTQSSDIYRIIHLFPTDLCFALLCVWLILIGCWMSYMENCRNSFKPGVFIIFLWRRCPTFLAGNRNRLGHSEPRIPFLLSRRLSGQELVSGPWDCSVLSLLPGIGGGWGSLSLC